MITGRHRRIAAWALAAGAVAAASAAWLDALRTDTEPVSVAPLVSDSNVRPSYTAVATTAEAASVLEARNPFRVDHLHTAPQDDHESSGFHSDESPSHPVVEWSLRGVVGDPPRLVLVEGVPGRESGALIGWGPESEGLRIVAVRGDTVVLSASGELRFLAPEKVWR